jgi:hypothetical protein
MIGLAVSIIRGSSVSTHNVRPRGVLSTRLARFRLVLLHAWLKVMIRSSEYAAIVQNRDATTMLERAGSQRRRRRKSTDAQGHPATGRPRGDKITRS